MGQPSYAGEPSRVLSQLGHPCTDYPSTVSLVYRLSLYWVPGSLSLYWLVVSGYPAVFAPGQLAALEGREA